MKVTIPSVSRVGLGSCHSLAVVGGSRPYIWGTDQQGCLGVNKGSLLFNHQETPVPLSYREDASGQWSPGVPQGQHIPLTEVAAGWKHSLGLTGDGRMYSWGWSGAVGGAGPFEAPGDFGAGQLGLGDDMDQWEPIQVCCVAYGARKVLDVRHHHVSGATSWRALQVAAGRNHSAAVIETPVDVDEEP